MEKIKEKFNPLVSIVIPVYNGANYMREAIDSALAQTYKNIEIIVVNDGSKDNTEEIAKSYGDKIRYFSKENGGVATALNFAIEKSKGAYVSWLSHDDIYLPKKIEAQIDLIVETGETKSIFFSDWISIDGKGRIIQENKITLTHPDRMEYYLILEQNIHGCSLLIPKIVFEDVGLFSVDLLTTQDYTLWLKMAEKYRFIRCPISLLYGRKHIEQGSNSLKHLHDLDDFFNIQIKRLSSTKIVALFPENERLEACANLICLLNDRNFNKYSLIFYNQVKKIFSKNNQRILYRCASFFEQEEYQQLKSEYQQLKSEYQQLKSEYQQLKSEYQQLKSECKQLSCKLQQLTVKHRQLENCKSVRFGNEIKKYMQKIGFN